MARKSSSHDSLSSLREKAAGCRACHLWKDATQTVFGERELAAINPAQVVAMGTTAAQSVFGKITPINKSRGRLIDMADGRKTLVTVHPSPPICCGCRIRTPEPANMSALSAI